MAKTGFWLKGANGKLAGATIYKQNGETIMREVVSPSNPKTTQQLIQRIIMHTVMGSYSMMKEICDHSFEGLKKGQNTMAYFMKQNVQFAREKIATMQQQGTSVYGMYNFAPLGMKGFVANQYQVAMGSLPRIETKIMDDSTNTAYVSGFAENTYADVISKLGLRRGDQLTFLQIHPFSEAYGAVEFNFCRVILDPTNADGTSAPLSSKFINDDGTINLPSVRNEGKFYFEFNQARQITFAKEKFFGSTCAAVIASREGSNGEWLRSTTYLTYSETVENQYSLGECLAMAKGNNNGLYVQNELYLNNAGEGGAVASSDGPVVPIDPTPQPGERSITSAKVGDLSIIAGTSRTYSFAAGTTLPQNVTVTIAAANADGQTIAVLAGSQVAKEATISNGAATLEVNANSGVTYKIAWGDEEEYTPTAYMFTVQVASAGGGGDET